MLRYRFRMATPEHKDALDRTFEVGIVLKGVDGLLELVGGLVILLVSPQAITRVVAALTEHELSEDPHDFVATHLLHSAHGLSGSAIAFGSAYLLSHGLVKVLLVGALLKGRLWAYPLMIAFLVAFIGYQLYRIASRPTIGLSLLTVFDAAIVALTVREYRKQRGFAPGSA